MKFVIVLVALIAAVFAAPPLGIQSRPQGIGEIVRQESHVAPDGYSYAWETNDGSSASESGQLRNVPGTQDVAIAATGEFSFVAPDGQTYSVQYVADENGFQPHGVHLPA